MPVSTTSDLSRNDGDTPVASVPPQGDGPCSCNHGIGTSPGPDWLHALVDSVVGAACEDLALHNGYDDAEVCPFLTIIEPPIRFEQVTAVRGTLSWHTQQGHGPDTEVHAWIDADVTLEGRALKARLDPSTDEEVHVYDAHSNDHYMHVGSVHIGRMLFVLTVDRGARSVSDIEFVKAMAAETFPRHLP